MTEATDKQIFTVERAYLAPVYVHVQVEATSPEEAARLAMDETAYPWTGDKVDYENSRSTYIDGIWRGDAYSHATYEVPADLVNKEEPQLTIDGHALALAIRGILDVGTGNKERDDALALAKLTDIRRLLDNLPKKPIPDPVLRVDQVMALRQVVENDAETINNTDFDSPVDADGARAIHATALEAVEALERHHGFPPRAQPAPPAAEPEMSDAEVRAAHIEQAAIVVIHQRDYFAEHAVYDSGMTMPERDQAFDDWAADTLQKALNYQPHQPPIAVVVIEAVRQTHVERARVLRGWSQPGQPLAEAVEALHSEIIASRRPDCFVARLASLVEALARMVEERR